MRRVVVTGIGVITALGTGIEKTWNNLIDGKTGVGNIESFDASEISSQVAAEVKDFDPIDFGIEKKEVKKLARYTQFAIAASKMALEDANFIINDENAEKIGVLVSSGIGGMDVLEAQHKILLEKGPKKVSPFTVPAMIENMASGNISIYFGAKGPNKTVVTACAAGTHSIGDAFEMIKWGRVDAMIAGGTEACITNFTISSFASMKALSTRNEEPEKSSRPFTSNRDGFVMGEGAGVLILEEYESAKARGAKMYAEIIGYGETGDAYHITSPAPGGEGAVRAIKMALAEGNIKIEDVDYINAHGTSTPTNDRLETAAIKTVFGEHAYKLAVSSTKGATGHALGGAGGIEAVILAKAIKEGTIPPTINHDGNEDPECDLYYVPNKAEKRDIRVALSNSLGFGGHNAVIAMKKIED